MKPASRLPQIALIWSQFTDTHVDRCDAVADRFSGRAEILAVEVATTSTLYAQFSPGREMGAARKVTLFPGQSFDAISRWRRLWKCLLAVRKARVVCLGVSYGEWDFLLLCWLLRLAGKRVILTSCSKFDDFPRRAWFELVKAAALSCFEGVLTSGGRGRDYFRFLGFRRRPIVTGYNSLALDRIRAQVASAVRGAAPDFVRRDFVFVGRFIDKKDLSVLIEAFARYLELEPASQRRLVLIGGGPMERELREQAARQVPDGRVEFPGFLEGAELYGRVAQGLCLVLVSCSEQWGLVINEAMALGQPIIASRAPGARDILVRNLINGFVLELGSVEGIARAMQRMGADEAAWAAMSSASGERAAMGDARVFAQALEQLVERHSGQPAADHPHKQALGELGDADEKVRKELA
ncbi:MAG TPA: glycosyltransferase [Novosphingobium sp.]|nr:glycosyltransferase [Novosphingobium sp.]